MRIIAIGFVLVGLLQLTWCASSWHEALLSTHWPTTTGTITSARVVEVKSRGGTTYQPTVSYTYEVGGIRYQGNRIQILDHGETSGVAQYTIDVFRAARVVQVYFDSDNPNKSILIPGADPNFFVWLAVSLLAIVVGGAMSYFLWFSASAKCGH